MPTTDTTMPGNGSSLSIESVTPGTYTVIPEVVSIDGPEAETGERETTPLGAALKIIRPTLLDAGEVTATMNFDSTNAVHAGLYTKFLAKTYHNWRIHLFVPTGTADDQFDFEAWIKGFKFSGFEPEGTVQVEMTLRITAITGFTDSAP